MPIDHQPRMLAIGRWSAILEDMIGKTKSDSISTVKESRNDMQNCTDSHCHMFWRPPRKCSKLAKKKKNYIANLQEILAHT